jgi:uncharacterized protein YdhG (YjbR/CyaY superfamily)
VEEARVEDGSDRLPDSGRAMPVEASDSARIDEILAGLPEDQRTALQSLREKIAGAAPEAVEALSYSLPAFKYRGRPLVSYGASKSHVAFYVMSPAAMDAHRNELAGYDTTKGGIRFQPDKPLPTDLVRAIVRTRMAETDEAAARKR